MTEAKSIKDFSYFPYWNETTSKYSASPLSKLLSGGSSVKISGDMVNIQLGTPKDEYLENYYEDGGGATTPKPGASPESTESPVSAKLFVLSSMDESSCFISSDFKYVLYCMKDINNCAILIYTDRDVTIKEGAALYEDFKGSNVVAIQKGWNYFTVSINKATKTITATSSKTLPAGFKWTVINPEMLDGDLL